ncbi:uncharacterized protein B0T15DRAFT_382826, partial [Chaetomium strumarium]
MSSPTPDGTGGSGVIGPPTPDQDHGDQGPNMIAAAFTAWTISLVFVLLRFWTRARIVHSLGPTDWFIALALIASGGMCVSAVEQCKHGMGKHMYDIDMHVDYAPMMEAWWFTLLCYILALALTKVSVCLLYLTIFTFEWARRACYAILVIVVTANIWATATTFTYCIPLEAAWNPNVVASFCQPQAAWWVNTGLTLATDIIIVILPIPIVLPLKLPRRQKLIVVGIFAVGFLVCLVSLIRLAILLQFKSDESSSAPDAFDFTYHSAKLFYCTTLEVNTAIVVACAMTLKPLLARFLPRLLHHHHQSAKPGEEDPSAVSSGGPPLTIGSRPSRQKQQAQSQGYHRPQAVVVVVEEELVGEGEG